MKTQSPSKRVIFGRAALFALGAVVTAPSWAQVPNPPSASAAAGSEVIKLEAFGVSGTHIAGASTFTSPTPVTVVESSDLVAAAPSNLAARLKQLPSIVPGGGVTNSGGTGNSSANFLNLRGLGSTRTLTLLDGRRFTSSGPTGQVDANLIPQGLVHHVDVVNGGASAAYGSDAIGGVINFVLNKEFVGTKIDAAYGIAQKGDNKEFKSALTYGAELQGGRAHLLLSAEYYDNKGVTGDARSLRRHAPNQIPDPARPGFLASAAEIKSPFTTGGHIVVGAGGPNAAANNLFRGIMFGPGGVQQTYNYGRLSGTLGATGGFQDGGDGFAVSTGQEIVRPLTRKAIFGRTDFKLNDKISLFVEGSMDESNIEFNNSPTTHTITIRRTNAYLAQVAPNIVNQMTATGVTTLTMNRLTLERGFTMSHANDKNGRVLLGLTGKLGSSWKWDAAYQWGNNDLRIPVTNNLITAKMALAADAVLSGTQIICASQATNPDCVPFNPFGVGAPSKAALDYVMATSGYKNYTVQKVADGSLSGELFNLPSGPVSIATGAQWRNLASRTTADPLSYASGYRLVNTQYFYGDYSIMEEFAEAQLPLVKEINLAKKLSANIAVRHTNYSTSGGVNTWKAGLVWQIYGDLRLRATRSGDIRAPSLNELFAAGVQNNVVANDNFPGGTGKSYPGVPNLTFGNLDLRPEKALSSVIGFVYQPSFLKGFSVAVDYYQVKVSDAIANAGGQNAVQQCDLNPSSPLCAFVTREATAADPRAVVRLRTSPVNLSSETLNGLDIETSYRVPLSTWIKSFNPGTLNLRALVGYVDEYVQISPLVPSVNNAGNGVFGLPHVRGTLTVNHTVGRFSTFLQTRYIGRATWDKTRVLGVTTDFNDVVDAAYLDGQFGFKTRVFGRDTEFYLNIQNILNKGLVYTPKTGGATPLPTDQGMYDQVGRMFRFGVNARF